jgi:hypothetical protein
MTEPSVRAVLRTRLNPAIHQAIDEVKATITEDGFFGVPEFKEVAAKHQFSEETLLGALWEEGIWPVKTLAANKDLEQEVLVDMRFMAAVMLLAYSDKNFGLRHSVFKFVETIYKISEWRGAFPVIILHGLMKDMYGTHGHNFTDQSIAEEANLTHEDEKVILERARRHTQILRELVKSDAELTAVFQLAMRTMDVANATTINGHTATRADVQFRRFEKPLAYNAFWTAAMKVVDRHVKRSKSKLH